MSDARALSTKKGGFTLLEVIIALALLSGVVLTVIISLNFHVGVAQRDKAVTIATLLAREKIEEIKLSGLPTESEGEFEGGFEEFRWNYETKEMGFREVSKLYVTVSWGSDESVTVESYEDEKTLAGL